MWKARLSMDTILLPEMQQALQAGNLPLCGGKAAGQPDFIAAAAGRQGVPAVALAQAQNHDQKLARQDIDMYLERLQNAKPISERVGRAPVMTSS